MSGRFVHLRLLLLLAGVCMVVTSGCGYSAAARRNSPQVREILNLRNNIEILRDSLSTSQREAERYRGLHAVERVQLDTARSDLLWLEAKHRVLLGAEQRLGRDLQAEREASMRQQLELDKLRQITADLAGDPEKANLRIKQLEATLRESQVWVEQLLVEKRQLNGQVEALRKEMSGNAEIPSVITEQMASLKTELERAQGEAAQYKIELFETRKARDDAAALVVSAQQTSDQAGRSSVFDFLWVWGKHPGPLGT